MEAIKFNCLSDFSYFVADEVSDLHSGRATISGAIHSCDQHPRTYKGAVRRAWMDVFRTCLNVVCELG